VTPDTILRWYRELIVNKYDGSARRGCGRSGTVASLQRLVVQFATENPTWGYTRLRGVHGPGQSLHPGHEHRPVHQRELRPDPRLRPAVSAPVVELNARRNGAGWASSENPCCES
jgi:hypothetical protein